MKIYFSNWYGFEYYIGLHFLPDNLGYPEKKGNKEGGLAINFQLYYVKSKNLAKKIGNVMVLSPDSRNMREFFEQEGNHIEGNKIYDVTKLFRPKMIVSMPNNIEYYKAIASLFEEQQAINILKRLCDVSYYKDNLNLYKNWYGFTSRFYRDNSSSKSILKNGTKIAMGSYEINGVIEIALNDLGDSFEPFTLSFNKLNDIPREINLIIGKNGLGKTHILKEVCDVITGLKSARSKPLFNKLIVVSYSPFESFNTNRELSELLSVKYGLQNPINIHDNPLSINDYTYIGFRNVEGQFDREWPTSFSAKSILNSIEYDRDVAWWAEGGQGKLKTIFSTLSLSMKFDTIRFKTIKNKNIDVTMSGDKINFNNEDEEINYQAGASFLNNGEEIKLSSGQQIYSFMIPSIVSEIQDETLIIIDEPELYLHPALEIGLIEMLKTILKNRKSYAIIATHSSLIAREVQRNCVHVLKEATFGTMIDRPNIETYGESLEEIIGEIFDDYSIKKPYQHEIDDIMDEKLSLNENLDKLSHKIGDEGLVYLASKINSSN
ncbi:AAA family ATPase [Enterobacter cloacae complex sp. CARB60]|uniref:AAA family ATPase n=1 Tax=Enterobacter cloacae complex sp. CARB60 TaxID=3119569 RepID=UPI002F41A231